MKRDWRHVLATITIPTLVVAGGASQIFPPQSSEYIAQAIEGSEFFLFDRCGHALFYEEPTKFNQLIEDFVSRLE